MAYYVDCAILIKQGSCGPQNASQAIKPIRSLFWLISGNFYLNCILRNGRKLKKKSIMLNIIEIFKVLGYRPENAGPLALKMQVAYFLI